MTIRSMLHDGPIYDGLQRQRATPIPGWNDHSEMFAKLLRPTDRIGIEIGSWLGASIVKMANAAPNAEIVAVDTFQGAAEMWMDKRDVTRYGALKIRHGHPTLYHDFRQNIFNHGKENQVTPFPVSSSVALEWLEKKGLTIDFAYVDGSHSYRDVLADLQAVLKLKPRLVMGDDLQPGWPGVVQAVSEMKMNHQTGPNGFWWAEFIQ